MDIERLQADMKHRGLYPGRIDGAWGPVSERAYQEALAILDKAVGRRPLPEGPLAWGQKVSPTFRDKVRDVCAELLIENPDWLMACMAFETGETFSPSVENGVGSGATGLIQFMPNTARHLGTTTAKLARMDAVEQLDWVRRYFEPYRGRLNSLGDLYMAILWPAGVGKADDWVLWDRDTRLTTYRQNRGLDANRDKTITRGEAVAEVQAKLERGRRFSA